MVSQDKSMQAMVQNDEQKRWMQPILDFRNMHLAGEDRAVRDFRRLNNRLTVFKGELVHGPYKQEHRAKLLRELLRTQLTIQEAGRQAGGARIELISVDEMDEIRRIWIEEKGEIEDLVPLIYQEVYGGQYPGRDMEQVPLDSGDLDLLKHVAKEVDPTGSEELYKLTRGLLAAQFQAMDSNKRSKHLDRLEETLRRYAFRNEEEALAFALSSKDTDVAGDDAGDATNLIV